MKNIATVKRVKLFYLGRRYNPQFNKPYYVAYGQLSKADVKRKENCIYGSMTLTGYETQDAYNAAIAEHESNGLRVSK